MQTAQHGPLTITRFADPIFATNTLVVCADNSDGCLIVDPGFPPNAEQVAATLAHRQRPLRPEAILLTHGHGDHIAGIPELRQRFPGTPVSISRAEADLLSNADANLSAPFGMALVVDPAEHLLDPGGRFAFGLIEFDILDVAGHSPGGIAFYCRDAGVVIAGDALFAGGIGRTDFPGSDLDRLLDNITRNLLSLPDETVVYPGHGDITTVGRERADNPYLQQGFSG